MTRCVYFIAVLVLHFELNLAWDPDAGLVESWTKKAGVTVTATSSVSPVNQVLDNNDNSHWTSDFCLPSGYVNRQNINILYGTCNLGLCSSLQASLSELAKATDGSFYHAANIRTATGTDGTRKATLTITFPAPTNVTMISLWGVFRATTNLTLLDNHGVATLLKVLHPPDSHNETRLPITISFNVKKIRIESTDDFIIKELSAMGSNGCSEQVTIDLGTQFEIGYVRTRHWAGRRTARSLVLKISNDSSTWSTVASLNPDALHAVVTRITSQKARYIALEYRVVLKSFNKVYCWEIDAWDKNGEWGQPINGKPQTDTLRELLGVNGIWGWGHGKYSRLLKSSEGAGLYNAIASHARNYHNLDWDVTDPDNSPEFAKMDQCNCTSAKRWLNWDWEYSQWVNKNLKIDTSIQFTNKMFSQNKWNHAEPSSFNYGREFATHFGIRHGNGLVTSMEVGNEPWDYDASFYATVLKGMSAGVRSVDDVIEVLPGAFQAHNKYDTGNYIGTRVFNDVAGNISAINFHTYSYYVNGNGIRVATYPEQVDSSFNSIRNIVRWRDTNTPSKSVWVTEWGWDAPGGGENCTFSECVTETAQALYAIRGLLILSRSNVKRVTWFFYSNTDTCNHLYCRSGLTTSKKKNFAKKAVFYAFEAILNFLGDKHFLGILREDDTAYVYAFGTGCNWNNLFDNSTELLMKSTHIVAWKPVDAADSSINTVTLHLPSDTVPLRGWKFTGNYAAIENFNSFQMDGHDLTLTVSTKPVIIEISNIHITSNQIFG